MSDPCCSRGLSSWKELGLNRWRDYSIPFVGAYLLSLVVYSYFFTTVIFTNHTLPNVWIYAYPSFKTTQEGRWFADILIYLTGGSGVQSLQMFLAAGIQILNGFLLAALLGVTNRFRIFLIAAFLSLHPAVLDYYCFTIDHISFTLGDALALLGVLALDRIKNRRLGIGLAIACFVLALATYQPKIALITLLLLGWCSAGATAAMPGEENGHSPLAQLCLTRILPATFSFVTAIVLYYFSLTLTISFNTGVRTTINSLEEMLRQLVRAYPEVWHDFTDRTDYLPHALAWLPAFGILLGLVAMALRAWRIHKGLLVAALVTAALVPAALQLPYIINNQTFLFNGRIITAQAYCLVGFLAAAWSLPRVSCLITALLTLFVYYFSIVGSQEANSAAMKNIYERSQIDRIVTRIEESVPDLYSQEWPVVVVGRLPRHDEGPLRKYNNSFYRINARNEAFAFFRQVEILNFFLGHEVVRRPAQAEVDAVLAGQQGRKPWPAPDCVYVQDNVIVVLLQSYAPGIPVTWAK